MQNKANLPFTAYHSPTQLFATQRLNRTRPQKTAINEEEKERYEAKTEKARKRKEEIVCIRRFAGEGKIFTRILLQRQSHAVQLHAEFNI